MEERETYTYKKKNKQTLSIPKLILLIVAVAVIAVAAITAMLISTNSTVQICFFFLSCLLMSTVNLSFLCYRINSS